MSDQPYPPLRPQRPVRSVTRPTPWPMIVGIGILALLAGVVLAILLGGDADGGVASGSTAASPAPSASGSASPLATESAAASASAQASATPAASLAPAEPLPVGGFVAPVVEGVTLRESPTTSGTRLGSLGRGSVNLVVEGPVEADGLPWYRLSAQGLPPSSGCVDPLPTDPLECPIWFGWAAARDPSDGTAWFAPAEVGCPDPDRETAAFLRLPSRVPIGCYGTAEIAFTAWYPEPSGDPGAPCEVDPAVAWLYCTGRAATVWTTPEEAVASLGLYVDPESGVTLPAAGQWLRITGAFDHPDAPQCREAEAAVAADPSPDLAVLECRTHFVVRAADPTAAP